MRGSLKIIDTEKMGKIQGEVSLLEQSICYGSKRKSRFLGSTKLTAFKRYAI